MEQTHEPLKFDSYTQRLPSRSTRGNRGSSNSHDENSSDDDDHGGASKRGRGVDNQRSKLPPAAVEILRRWLLSPEHFDHPYPTPAEKDDLARECDISHKQLVNWLTNARKRLWQPLRKKQGKPIVPYAQAKSARRLEEISQMSQHVGASPPGSPQEPSLAGPGGMINNTPEGQSWIRQYPSLAGLVDASDAGSRTQLVAQHAPRQGFMDSQRTIERGSQNPHRIPPSLPRAADHHQAFSRLGSDGSSSHNPGLPHALSSEVAGAGAGVEPSAMVPAQDPQELLAALRREACSYPDLGDQQQHDLHVRMRLDGITAELEGRRASLLRQLRSVDVQSAAVLQAESLVHASTGQTDVASTLRMLSKAIEASEEHSGQGQGQGQGHGQDRAIPQVHSLEHELGHRHDHRQSSDHHHIQQQQQQHWHRRQYQDPQHHQHPQQYQHRGVAAPLEVRMHSLHEAPGSGAYSSAGAGTGISGPPPFIHQPPSTMEQLVQLPGFQNGGMYQTSAAYAGGASEGSRGIDGPAAAGARGMYAGGASLTSHSRHGSITTASQSSGSTGRQYALPPSSVAPTPTLGDQLDRTPAADESDGGHGMRRIPVPTPASSTGPYHYAGPSLTLRREAQVATNARGAYVPPTGGEGSSGREQASNGAESASSDLAVRLLASGAMGQVSGGHEEVTHAMTGPGSVKR